MNIPGICLEASRYMPGIFICVHIYFIDTSYIYNKIMRKQDIGI